MSQKTCMNPVFVILLPMFGWFPTSPYLCGKKAMNSTISTVNMSASLWVKISAHSIIPSRVYQTELWLDILLTSIHTIWCGVRMFHIHLSAYSLTTCLITTQLTKTQYGNTNRWICHQCQGHPILSPLLSDSTMVLFHGAAPSVSSPQIWSTGQKIDHKIDGEFK